MRATIERGVTGTEEGTGTIVREMERKVVKADGTKQVVTIETEETP